VPSAEPGLVRCSSRIAAYFLPERETTITRDAKAEEIRETVIAVKPLVRELKDFKELQK